MSSNPGGQWSSRALKKKSSVNHFFAGGRSRAGNECPWVNSRQMLFGGAAG